MRRFSLLVLWMGALVAPLSAFPPDSTTDALSEERTGWKQAAPREEIRPAFHYSPKDGKAGGERLSIACDKEGQAGYWTSSFLIEGGKHYRVAAWRRTVAIEAPRRAAYLRLRWQGDEGKSVNRELPVVGPYHPAGQPTTALPEYPPDVQRDGDWTLVGAVVLAPAAARKAVIELHLQGVSAGRVDWSDIKVEKVDPPRPRPVRLATVHFIPRGAKTAEEACRLFEPLIEDAVRQRADLVVLPETITQTGTGKSYADVAEAIPGPSTDYFGELAKRHKLHLVVGLVERAGREVFNVAVLIGPEGEVIGKYRKVLLPWSEVEQGVSPGDDFPVFDTALGRIGMMVCYDGFHPEPARELAARGAEVIAFPVAGCNPLLARARACENQVYIVSSSYTAVERNWMISAVIGHEGETLAQAKEWGAVAVAEVDLSQRTFWAWIGDFGRHVERHRPVLREKPLPEKPALREKAAAK